MKATFTLPTGAERAIEAIRATPQDEPHTVTIQPKAKDRTAAQNATMWMWITLIAGELGETKDAIHERFKKKYLVRIFERDDPEGYGRMVSAIRQVHTCGMKTEAAAMAEQVVKLTSTTHASVRQMCEYLTDIERGALEMGITLPHPSDLYYEAMGINR